MKITRIVILVIFLALFGGLAYYIYDKQNNHYSFLSFEIDHPEGTFIINDMDQLRRKVTDFSEISTHSLPSVLMAVSSTVFGSNSVLYNEELGESCYVSFNATDFVFALKNPDLSLSDFVLFANTNFGLDWKAGEGMVITKDHFFYSRRFSQFLVFSNQPITARPTPHLPVFDNADFILYKDSTYYERNILTSKYHHKIWTDANGGEIMGRPVHHEEFIRKAPKTFDSFQFYGSTRFTKDQDIFFNQPQVDQFSWVRDGVLRVQKDSFELLISPQNDARDLRLILEEQTLADQMDTVQIKTINLKSFEIMPFKSSFIWKDVIPGLKEDYAYYMEFENFNVLSNSIGAMRWYISAIQTGDLLSKQDMLENYYQQVAPSKAHYLSAAYDNTEKAVISFDVKSWTQKGICKVAHTAIVLKETAKTTDQTRVDFEVTIIPKRIDLIATKDGQALLLSNENGAIVYNEHGQQLWRYDFPEPLIGVPQIIDFENDKKSEIVFFMKQLVVIKRADGSNVPGWSKKMNAEVRGGACLNYDNNYDYRIFVDAGESILAFDEDGEHVQGFKFTGMKGGLANSIDYALINGKDYISFKDKSNQLFLLTRRGENRFPKTRVVDLPNETDFLVGEREETIRKMGYNNQYIYSYYIKDGNLDSVKLDRKVNPIRVSWLKDHQSPQLVIEEENRVLIIDKFGYIEREIVKPTNAKRLISVSHTKNMCFVLFDDANNSLYLLDKDGKMVLSNTLKSTEIYTITDSQIYTFDGLRLKAYKF